MKACVIQNFMNAGGLEKNCVVIMELLNELGYKIHLCSLRPPAQHVIESSFNRKLNITSFTELRYALPIRTNRWNLNSILLKVDSRVNADIYVNTMSCCSLVELDRDAPSMMYVGIVPQIPINMKDKEMSHWKKACVKIFNWYTYRKLEKILERARVITPSNFLKNHVHELWKVNADVINPPIDVDQYRCTPEDVMHKDSSCIALVGRFHPGRAFEVGISVAEKICDSKLHVFGARQDDNYLQFIRSSVAKSPANSRIKLRIQEPLPERAAMLRRCKVYLHSGINDGFGGSIVEAMAAGCIPVVHDSGGPTEYVPRKWRYSSFDECLTKVGEALQASPQEHLSMVELAEQFHERRFKEAVMKIIRSM